MKIDYKGFEISVEREKSLAGYDMLFFYIMRKSDTWFLVDSFEDSEETIKNKIEHMKETIDDYLKNPEDYEDDDLGDV
jgi:hypothetical protein